MFSDAVQLRNDDDYFRYNTEEVNMLEFQKANLFANLMKEGHMCQLMCMQLFLQ